MTKEEIENLINDKLKELIKEIEDLKYRLNITERDIRIINVYGGKY